METLDLDTSRVVASFLPIDDIATCMQTSQRNRDKFEDMLYGSEIEFPFNKSIPLTKRHLIGRIRFKPIGTKQIEYHADVNMIKESLYTHADYQPLHKIPKTVTHVHIEFQTLHRPDKSLPSIIKSHVKNIRLSGPSLLTLTAEDFGHPIIFEDTQTKMGENGNHFIFNPNFGFFFWSA
jgi:hypothetical protein